MYVRVKIDNKQETIVTTSKLTQVEDLKHEMEKELHIEADLQRLFFRGKQLENGYKLYDYNINLNDVIQLMVKLKPVNNTEKGNEAMCSTNSDDAEKQVTEEDELVEAECLYYKVGDAVDSLDPNNGAWFEAIILKILKKDDEIIYNIRWEFDDSVPHLNVPELSIRPRARCLLEFNSLKIGQKVMINYNVDEPTEAGLWYDFTVLKMNKTRRVQELTGTLHIGREELLGNCKVDTKGEIFMIEEPKLLKDRTPEDEQHMKSNGRRRRIQAICNACSDNNSKQCKECGCRICAGKQEEHNLLLCDECNYAFHLSCLNPPLTSIPENDYWYCPDCKNDENEIVKAGDKLKQTKRKTTEEKDNKKDWGKGMACMGRTKVCTIVPPSHRGSIPRVEVGMIWMFRVQVSEAGVHRPHVAGIHVPLLLCRIFLRREPSLSTSRKEILKDN